MGDHYAKFKKEFESLKTRALRFKELYDAEVDNVSTENNVLFVVNGSSLEDVDLESIMNSVIDKTAYACDTILLGLCKSENDADIAKKAAKAKFIFAANPIHIFAETVWRRDTKFILIRNVPFNLYNAGITEYKFLKWEKKLVNYRSKNDVTAMQIPSEEAKDVFIKNFSGNNNTDCSISGSCVTV